MVCAKAWKLRVEKVAPMASVALSVDTVLGEAVVTSLGIVGVLVGMVRGVGLIGVLGGCRGCGARRVGVLPSIAAGMPRGEASLPG